MNNINSNISNINSNISNHTKKLNLIINLLDI